MAIKFFHTFIITTTLAFFSVLLSACRSNSIEGANRFPEDQNSTETITIEESPKEESSSHIPTPILQTPSVQDKVVTPKYSGLTEILKDMTGGYQVAFSPLDNALASTPSLLELVFYDYDADEAYWSIDVQAGEWGMSGKTKISFSPDGQILAAGGRDLRLDLYRRADGSILESYYSDVIFPVDTAYRNVATISDIKFTNDGRYILLASASDVGGLAIIDRIGGNAEVVFEKPIYEIALIPRKSSAALATRRVGTYKESDSPIVIFDYIDHQIIDTLFDSEDYFREEYYPHPIAESISFNGRYFASVIDSELRIWDYEEGHEIDIIHPAELVIYQQVLFTPDGSRLITLSNGPCSRIHWGPLDEEYTCTLSIWDVNSWKIIGMELISPATSMDVSSDSEVLVTGSFSGIQFWEIP